MILLPLFMSWFKDLRLFPSSQKAHFSKTLFTNVSKYSEHFSFAETIRPPHRRGRSRCWPDCAAGSTVKVHSKMSSFITQHNDTDVASWGEACIWHADCRNVHQSCCPGIECSFSFITCLQRCFKEFGSTSKLASQPQTTCTHTNPGLPNPPSPRWSDTSYPDSRCNSRFA